MRVIRAVAAGLLAVAAILAGLVWLTAPAAGEGELLLAPNTDFSQGPYFAYAGPWGGKEVALTRAWSRISDAVVIDLKRFPANTRMTWRWPPVVPSNGPGVWGFNYAAYANYAGGVTEQPVPPIRVRDVKAFRQAFRWSMRNRLGDANVLTEFFLRTSATDVNAEKIEIGWFLHAPESTRNFFGSSKLVGRYVDPDGRRWTVRMVEKFCMFAPEDGGDVPAGRLDMLHAIRWLQGRGLVSGEDWLWGVGIGAEPVTGMGELTLHDWRVVRR